MLKLIQPIERIIRNVQPGIGTQTYQSGPGGACVRAVTMYWLLKILSRSLAG